ncbi:MAG: NUDIX domain-containing protein [Trueperaceae bacterium]
MKETHEPLLVVAVAAVVFRGKRLLCMRRSACRDAGPGLWETLSGRVRPGEDPLAAVAREISEECGLEVELDPRPITTYPAKRIDEPMVVIVYRAQAISGEVVMSDEHDAFEWLTPDELAERSPLAPLVNAARLALDLSWVARDSGAPGNLAGSKGNK